MEINLSSAEPTFQLLSHPGRLLVDHLQNVLANGRDLAASWSLSADMRRALELTLILHDLGKATQYFQKYIKTIGRRQAGEIGEAEARAVYQELGYRKNHARISAVWAWIIACRIFGSESPLPIYIFIAILKHHGNLDNFQDMFRFVSELELGAGKVSNQKSDLLAMSEHLDYEEFGRLLQRNGFEVGRFDHQTFAESLPAFFHSRFGRRAVKSLSPNLDHFFQMSALFSVLLSCDKGECIFEGRIPRFSGELLAVDLIDRYKQIAFKNDDAPINQLRESAYHQAADSVAHMDLNQQRIYALQMPTGLGKTMTALNVAYRFRQRFPALKKIVYCLPFTSVIDQVGKVVTDVYEKTGFEAHSENVMLYHHLSELDYRAKDDRGEIDDYRGDFLISEFQSRLSITTFYQLLHGILTHKNREVRKFQAFMNSVVILDEVQAVPYRYWPLIRQVLTDFASRYNVVFILVTATMPLIFRAEHGEVEHLLPECRHYYQQLDRIRLQFGLLKKECRFQLADFADFMIEEAKHHLDDGMLVIVNTRALARKLYELVAESMPDQALLFLSGDIVPKTRLGRIMAIKKASGKGLIVISTQLVEAGVDIDLGRVYRQNAPLDSVLQSAGRCNRNGFRPGTVVLFDLCDENGKQIGLHIYGNLLVPKTQELFGKKLKDGIEELPESAFFDLAQDYYRLLAEYGNSSESDDLLAALSRLNYKSAFDVAHYQRKGGDMKPFQLIEENDALTVYVVLDEEAKTLYHNYHKLRDQPADPADPFRKNRDLKAISREMAKYMVHTFARRVSPAEKDAVFFETVAADGVDFPHVVSGFTYDSVLGLTLQESETGNANF